LIIDAKHGLSPAFVFDWNRPRRAEPATTRPSGLSQTVCKRECEKETHLASRTTLAGGARD